MNPIALHSLHHEVQPGVDLPRHVAWLRFSQYTCFKYFTLIKNTEKKGGTTKTSEKQSAASTDVHLPYRKHCKQHQPSDLVLAVLLINGSDFISTLEERYQSFHSMEGFQ